MSAEVSLISVVLASFLVGGIWAPSMLILGLAIWSLNPAILHVDGGFPWLIALIWLLAIPLAAGLAALFLDRFMLEGRKGELLRTPAMVLAGVIALSALSSGDFISVSLAVSQAAPYTELIAAFTGVINLILFCGTGTALILIGVVLLFELPILWMCSANRVVSQPFLLIRGVRVLSCILILSLTLNFVVSFFAHELWPRSIW